MPYCQVSVVQRQQRSPPCVSIYEAHRHWRHRGRVINTPLLCRYCDTLPALAIHSPALLQEDRLVGMHLTMNWAIHTYMAQHVVQLTRCDYCPVPQCIAAQVTAPLLALSGNTQTWTPVQ